MENRLFRGDGDARSTVIHLGYPLTGPDIQAHGQRLNQLVISSGEDHVVTGEAISLQEGEQREIREVGRGIALDHGGEHEIEDPTIPARERLPFKDRFQGFFKRDIFRQLFR